MNCSNVLRRWGLRLAFCWATASNWDSGNSIVAQQISGQDIDKILERADKLLDEAKAGYEEASSKGSVSGFIDAGFKLEEARIKYLVLQEIGSADKQKLAADRLRAVNQLGKLIHDGKVAVGGTPAEPAPPKPADPAPTPKEPQLASLPPMKAVDVSKRAPIPDPKKQQEAEKLIKELFKEQYAKKAPSDRRALARLLLDQAAKSQEDPTALWVLVREAQDLASQNGDVSTALEAVEVVARFFDVDALAMKNAALGNAARSARTSEEFAALSVALLKLIEDLVRADSFDAADKVASSVVQHAKSSKDQDLISRASLRAKEVSEAKALFQSMKSVLEIQAKNPDDPTANLEIGRFLCFVKGSWDLGLRFMAKGSDAALKALAERELSFPAQAADRAALGDSWYELAEREKSPLKKSQLQAHAKTVYESALPDAVALVRAKIEKRLEELERGSAGSLVIDLLGLVDPKRDGVNGRWTLERGCLGIADTPNPWAQIQFPYVFPDEYDLKLSVKAPESFVKVGIVLPLGDHQGMVFVGQYEGNTAGLDALDGRGWAENSARVTMTQVRTASIVCSVRKTGGTIVLDGKKLMEWKDNSKFNYANPTISNKRALTFFGGTRLQLDQARLIAISGQGKRIK